MAWWLLLLASHLLRLTQALERRGHAAMDKLRLDDARVLDIPGATATAAPALPCKTSSTRSPPPAAIRSGKPPGKALGHRRRRAQRLRDGRGARGGQAPAGRAVN